VTGVAKTTLEVAAAIGRDVRFVEQLLRDEQARGTIECVDGRWALTSARESLAPLRDLPHMPEEDRP
jgi:hypothetical protein